MICMVRSGKTFCVHGCLSKWLNTSLHFEFCMVALENPRHFSVSLYLQHSVSIYTAALKIDVFFCDANLHMLWTGKFDFSLQSRSRTLQWHTNTEKNTLHVHWHVRMLLTKHQSRHDASARAKFCWEQNQEVWPRRKLQVHQSYLKCWRGCFFIDRKKTLIPHFVREQHLIQSTNQLPLSCRATLQIR